MTYTGTLYTYEHPGQDGGTWYAAQYPTGTVRYYRTAEARERKVADYIAAMAEFGGFVLRSDG